jgi:hypothetical protein
MLQFEQLLVSIFLGLMTNYLQKTLVYEQKIGACAGTGQLWLLGLAAEAERVGVVVANSQEEEVYFESSVENFLEMEKALT